MEEFHTKHGHPRFFMRLSEEADKEVQKGMQEHAQQLYKREEKRPLAKWTPLFLQTKEQEEAKMSVQEGLSQQSEPTMHPGAYILDVAGTGANACSGGCAKVASCMAGELLGTATMGKVPWGDKGYGVAFTTTGCDIGDEKNWFVEFWTGKWRGTIIHRFRDGKWSWGTPCSASSKLQGKDQRRTESPSLAMPPSACSKKRRWKPSKPKHEAPKGMNIEIIKILGEYQPDPKDPLDSAESESRGKDMSKGFAAKAIFTACLAKHKETYCKCQACMEPFSKSAASVMKFAAMAIACDKKEQQFNDKFLELMEIGLDVVGTFAPPPIGTIADIMSAAWYFYSDQHKWGWVSLIGLVPVVGDSVQSMKLLQKAQKTLQKTVIGRAILKNADKLLNSLAKAATKVSKLIKAFFNWVKKKGMQVGKRAVLGLGKLLYRIYKIAKETISEWEKYKNKAQRVGSKVTKWFQKWIGRFLCHELGEWATAIKDFVKWLIQFCLLVWPKAADFNEGLTKFTDRFSACWDAREELCTGAKGVAKFVKDIDGAMARFAEAAAEDFGEGKNPIDLEEADVSAFFVNVHDCLFAEDGEIKDGDTSTEEQRDCSQGKDFYGICEGGKCNCDQPVVTEPMEENPACLDGVNDKSACELLEDANSCSGPQRRRRLLEVLAQQQKNADDVNENTPEGRCKGKKEGMGCCCAEGGVEKKSSGGTACAPDCNKNGPTEKQTASSPGVNGVPTRGSSDSG